MSVDQPGTSQSEPLQFDRAVQSPDPASAEATAGLQCANCGTTITTEYFVAAGQNLCRSCRTTIGKSFELARSRSRGAGALMKALAWGGGAAVAGAILYYAVIAITGWEIGIVALVIGFMVGWAVRRGSNGFGGRRYQVLALGLTYFAVGLAYSPLAIKEIMTPDSAADSAAVADSAAAGVPLAANDSSLGAALDSIDALVAASDSTATDSSGSPNVAALGPGQLGPAGLAIAFGAVFLFIFALPVIVVLGSMPGGIISALIIGFGMQQAWRMTAAVPFEITGPYRVGGETGAST